MSAQTLWDQLVHAHRVAQVCQTTIRDTASAQVFKDEAVQGLVRQTDRILTLLDTMAEQQLLTQIGVLLRQRGR